MQAVKLLKFERFCFIKIISACTGSGNVLFVENELFLMLWTTKETLGKIYNNAESFKGVQQGDTFSPL